MASKLHFLGWVLFRSQIVWLEKLYFSGIQINQGNLHEKSYRKVSGKESFTYGIYRQFKIQVDTPVKFLTLSLLSQQFISNCLNSKTLLSFSKLLGKLFKLLLNIHINVYHLYLPSKLEDHGLVPGPFVGFFFTFPAARPILRGSLHQSHYLVFLKGALSGLR